MTEPWAQAISLFLGTALGGTAAVLWLAPGRKSPSDGADLEPAAVARADAWAALDAEQRALSQALGRARESLVALQQGAVPRMEVPLEAARQSAGASPSPEEPSRTLAEQTQQLLEALQSQDGFVSHSLGGNEVLRDTLGKVSAGANLVDSKLGQVAPLFNEAALLCTAVTDHLQALHDTSRVSLSRATAVQSEWQGAFALLSAFSQRLDALQGGVGAVLDLASKAKLLSLNAAIVASQSQEHSQGFGVVAEQIKVMAQRTAETAHSMQAEVHGVAAFRAQFEALASQQWQTLTLGRTDHQAVQQLTLVAMSTNTSLSQLLKQRALEASHENTAVADLKTATSSLISMLIELNAGLRLQDKDHRRALTLAADVARHAAAQAEEYEALQAASSPAAREPALLACLAWQQRHAQQGTALGILGQALSRAADHAAALAQVQALSAGPRSDMDPAQADTISPNS